MVESIKTETLNETELESNDTLTSKPSFSQALDNLQRASLSLSIDNKPDSQICNEESNVDQTTKPTILDPENSYSTISTSNNKEQRENSNSPSNSSFSIAGMVYKYWHCSKKLHPKQFQIICNLFHFHFF